MRCPRSIPLLLLSLLSILASMFFLMFMVVPVAAQTPAPTPIPGVGGAKPTSEQDANCLMCHSDPDFNGRFANGESLSLTVDNNHYQHSVHGKAGLECVACHTDISRYPHHQKQQVSCLECHDTDGGKADSFVSLKVNLPFADRREMSLSINQSCHSCHEKEFDVAADSAHVKVMESGNNQAPICIDCHGSHEITPPNEPRSKISSTCGACHQSVYTTYKSSVHGSALEKDGNPDVPTCIECHGVHSVRGPRDPFFRNDSIVICGSCHTNTAVMSKYGISTQVMQTYLDDYHGRTVNLFRLQGSSISSNKAVCFDCHGIHNIRRPDDALSSVYPENLQHTCQQCHKDADIRFPGAWLSHNIPSMEKTPGLYLANMAYRLLIPLTLGFFFVYIALDVYRRTSDKNRFVRQALQEVTDDYDFQKHSRK